MKVDINCDVEEGFGTYEDGIDEEIMPYITSANIAYDSEILKTQLNSPNIMK